MWTTDEPATGFPASDKPSSIERPSKKDNKKTGRKPDRGTQGPRLCGNCGGTGRILDDLDGIHYCPVCNGDGIG